MHAGSTHVNAIILEPRILWASTCTCSSGTGGLQATPVEALSLVSKRSIRPKTRGREGTPRYRTMPMTVFFFLLQIQTLRT